MFQGYFCHADECISIRLSTLPISEGFPADLRQRTDLRPKEGFAKEQSTRPDSFADEWSESPSRMRVFPQQNRSYPCPAAAPRAFSAGARGASTSFSESCRIACASPAPTTICRTSLHAATCGCPNFFFRTVTWLTLSV